MNHTKISVAILMSTVNSHKIIFNFYYENWHLIIFLRHIDY